MKFCLNYVLVTAPCQGRQRALPHTTMTWISRQLVSRYLALEQDSLSSLSPRPPSPWSPFVHSRHRDCSRGWARCVYSSGEPTSPVTAALGSNLCFNFPTGPALPVPCIVLLFDDVVGWVCVGGVSICSHAACVFGCMCECIPLP